MAKHRRPILSDRTNNFPYADVQNDAICTRPNRTMPHCTVVCPRHDPVTYADQYARHATDSITPAERYHNFGVTR